MLTGQRPARTVWLTITRRRCAMRRSFHGAARARVRTGALVVTLGALAAGCGQSVEAGAGPGTSPSLDATTMRTAATISGAGVQRFASATEWPVEFVMGRDGGWRVAYEVPPAPGRRCEMAYDVGSLRFAHWCEGATGGSPQGTLLSGVPPTGVEGREAGAWYLGGLSPSAGRLARALAERDRDVPATATRTGRAPGEVVSVDVTSGFTVFESRQMEAESGADDAVGAAEWELRSLDASPMRVDFGAVVDKLAARHGVWDRVERGFRPVNEATTALLVPYRPANLGLGAPPGYALEGVYYADQISGPSLTGGLHVLVYTYRNGFGHVTVTNRARPSPVDGATSAGAPRDPFVLGDSMPMTLADPDGRLSELTAAWDVPPHAWAAAADSVVTIEGRAPWDDLLDAHRALAAALR